MMQQRQTFHVELAVETELRALGFCSVCNAARSAYVEPPPPVTAHRRRGRWRTLSLCTAGLVETLSVSFSGRLILARNGNQPVRLMSRPGFWQIPLISGAQMWHRLKSSSWVLSGTLRHHRSWGGGGTELWLHLRGWCPAFWSVCAQTFKSEDLAHKRVLF